jgi:hypothetical protein
LPSTRPLGKSRRSRTSHNNQIMTSTWLTTSTWILIGASGGLLSGGLTRPGTLPDVDTSAAMAQFEECLAGTQHPAGPLNMRRVLIYPKSQVKGGRAVNLVTFERLCESLPDGVLKYTPASFYAPRPFAAGRGESGTYPSIFDYLSRTPAKPQTPFFEYRYAWWREIWWLVAFWILAGIAFVGIALPTTVEIALAYTARHRNRRNPASQPFGLAVDRAIIDRDSTRRRYRGEFYPSEAHAESSEENDS